MSRAWNIAGYGLKCLGVISLLILTLLPGQKVEAQASQPIHHLVQVGDTLVSIADRYNITVEDLVALNGLDYASYIYVGQLLRLPGQTRAAPPPASGPSCGLSHMVQTGESLSGIAALYGVSTTGIAQTNGIANINVIHAGQRLCIPGGTASSSPRTPQPSPVPTAPLPTPTGLTYAVKGGDTLSAIARAHGTSVDALIRANGITNPSRLRPGQLLQIPGGGTIPSSSLTPAPVSKPIPASSPPNPAEAMTVHIYNTSYPHGTPSITRVEPVGTPYDWGLGRPGPRVSPDNFSVRLEGNFTFHEGYHRFMVTADDGVRLYLDGALVVDAWRDQPPTTYEADIHLTAGKHHVRVDYYEHTDQAYLWFRWQPLATGTAPIRAAPDPISEFFTVRFFNNLDMSGSPVRTETITSPIAYNWSGQSPGHEVNRDGFSAVAEGNFMFAEGTHRFLVSADDGVRLFIDDRKILDEWRDQAATTYFKDVHLAEGSHKVRLEYYERVNSASLNLRWEPLSPLDSHVLPRPEHPGLRLSYDRESRRNLFRAISAHDQDTVVHMLVNRGYPDFEYNHLTALHYAVQENALAILKILLDHHEADPHVSVFPEDDVPDEPWLNRRTPLHEAAIEGRPEAARLLLRKGADPDADTRRQYTPLHLAARFAHPEVAEYLLEYGANPNARRVSHRYTPLHEIVISSRDEEVMEVLLDHHGTDPNIRDERGITPLLLAVIYGEADLVTLLLSHTDTDPNAAIPGGAAPIHSAVRIQNSDILADLLDHRETDPNIRYSLLGNYTALHLAVVHENLQAARLLVAHPDTDLTLQSTYGSTALDVALYFDLTEFVTLLREHGAE